MQRKKGHKVHESIRAVLRDQYLLVTYLTEAGQTLVEQGHSSPSLEVKTWQM